MSKAKSYVYVVRAGKGSKAPIKVGMTGNVQKRIKALQTGNPQPLFLVMHFECKDRSHAYRLEKTIHEILGGQRMCGEWFKVTRSNLMKLLNNLGNKHQIDSLVKEMDIFDKIEPDSTVKLRKKLEAKEKEVEELYRGIAISKQKRHLYANKLIELGVSGREIGELGKKAKEIVKSS